jgi:hypothetical protein
MKHPAKLIRLPLFPLQTAPTPPSGLPTQTTERALQSNPFIGATSMVTPSASESAQPPAASRDPFAR